MISSSIVVGSTISYSSSSFSSVWHCKVEFRVFIGTLSLVLFRSMD